MTDTTHRSGTDDTRLRALLERCLVQHFGVDDPAFHDFVEDNSLYRELPAGRMLIRQGDTGTSVYFLLSGHMRALVGDAVIGEIGRGQTVGELALFTGKARSADVVATRDSIVAEVTEGVLKQAIARQPDLAFRITGEIIARFERQRAVDAPPAAPVTTTVLGITPDQDARAFAQALADERERAGDRVRVIDAAFVRDTFGALESPDTTLPRGEVSLAIGTMELDYDALIFVGHAQAPTWTQTAIHHSDEIVLLADARARPQLTDDERFLLERRAALRASTTLVLEHAADAKSPTGTARWLAPRTVQRHIHIRRGNARDLRRAGRILSGRAVGLVLAGGGARGLSHLGAIAALQAAGLEFDMVGGTSAGAIMGSFAAMDVPGDQLHGATRDIFLNGPNGNITGDYNWLPFLSLIKGERAMAAMEAAVAAHAVPGIDMEDTWKSFFVVVSDFTAKREVVLDRGPLARNVVASGAIPGVMPPTLIDGHLIHDGGSFNNFPVDHMLARGARRVIGVDLLGDGIRAHDLERVPSNREALWDRLRRGRKRRYRLPPLPATLLLATTVTSMSRQTALREHVDLLLKPQTRGLTLLSWGGFDTAWQYGVDCVDRALAEADADVIATLRTAEVQT